MTHPLRSWALVSFALLTAAALTGTRVRAQEQAQQPTLEQAPPQQPPPQTKSETPTLEQTQREPQAQEQTDPEPQPPEQTSPQVQDQIIVDPELAGSPPSKPPPTAAETQARSNAGSGEFRVVLHSRMATDLHREDPREDVWDNTTLATFEATVRRSDSLRFVVGMRARYHFSSLAHDLPDTRAAHAELDALPTAGYVDAKLAPGVHLQVGYQPVHLGRFDVFSGTNFLAVHDLRDGPASMPEAGEVGQLAALCDYDVNGWLSLRAVYLPFFTSHIVTLIESDYALLPATQAQANAVINSTDASMAGTATQLRHLLRANLDRGDRQRIAQSGLAAFAPQPDFSQPQGALRATAHGPIGELAITAGTALEHLPALRFSDNFVRYVNDPSFENQGYLASTPRPVVAEFKRFAVFSADAAADVGPLSVGMEAAYMVHRTFMTQGSTSKTMTTFSQPDTTDLMQVGARVEYIQSTRWLAVAEAFFAYTIREPGAGLRRWALMEDGRFARGVATLIGFTPDAFPLHIEVGAGLISGPSFLFAPRIGYSLFSNFDAELGALWVEGSAPPIGNSTQSLGAIYDNVDQVYFGLRYLP